MNKFKIPVSWECYGEVEIEANSLDEAIKIALEKQDELPLPESNYVDGSFKIVIDKDLLDALNN